MARPLRLQVPGAFYHVMSRGNAREPVFLDDVDRQHFLQELDRVTARLRWSALAYCLMPNHYHLLINTADATLARGMRDLNGTYAQGFNRRHGRIGHLFQGRYKALLIEKGAYLLEVIRYIARNPVAAGLCAAPDEWLWSSHHAILGLSAVPPCLAVDDLLRHFGRSRAAARRRYQNFVGTGSSVSEDGWLHPTVAGSDAFVATVVESKGQTGTEVPRPQRAVGSLTSYFRFAGERDEAIRLAYESGAYSMAEIARHFGLHYSTVSRICRVAATIRMSN
jgi:putative transposase